jgi:hypothetical protein
MMKRHLLRLSTLWLVLVAVVTVRAQDVTATWDFHSADGNYYAAGSANIQNAVGTLDATASDGSAITLTVDATNNGKLHSRGGGDAQFNNGTIIKVPVKSTADVVTVTSYPNYHYYTVGGSEADADTYAHTAKASEVSAGFVQIIATNTAYLFSISVTQKAGAAAVSLTWDYTSNQIPTKGPDNGLYYGAYVNDAPSTNMGLNGVKLNSSGYAFFEKPAVAGKLTLTIGNRKTADAYTVNVYACTVANGAATKGDLIGEVAVDASPNSGSIEIAADVTGIYF